jgi:hypothetical protein
VPLPLALALVLLAGAPTAAPAAKPSAKLAPATPPLPTHAAACRPKSAQRCSAEGCEAANEGLHAEQFELDLAEGWLGACLYTDCFHGKGRAVREPGKPSQVTVFGEVRSERRPDGVPPPGSDPFPLTISVDLRDGTFTAIWSLSPQGLQVDFGRCELRREPSTDAGKKKEERKR